MNLSQKLFVARKLAIVTLFSMFVQLVTPVAAFALTSGPSSPEFSSFEPVATNNMVDLFSGDFTYNIPVLDIPGAHGGGYAMSLSYHSGASLEEEASWVGYGWTLNPGAINHGKQGFSDDWDGVPINYYNKTKPNKTVNIFGSAGIEAFSQDFSAEDLPFNLGGFSLGAGISYNNYKGYRWNVDIGANIGGGTISLGYNINNSGDYPFRLDVSPMALLSFATMSLKKKEEQKKAAKKAKAAKDEKMEALNKSTDFLKNSASTGGPSSFASGYGLHDLNIERAFPKGTNRYSGFRVSIEASLLSTPAGLPLGFTAGLSGAYNKQISNNSQGKAFGYMNTSNSMVDDVLKENAQQDYRVENRDAVFDNKTPFIGIPINDADNYIVTGEGTMGGFRCYNRSGMTFKPEKIINTTLLFNGGVDFTTGVSFGVGASLASGDHTLKTDTWDVVGTIPWNNNTPSENADGREPYFFRFDSDMADGVFCKAPTLTPAASAVESNPNFSTESYLNSFINNIAAIGERYGINSSTLSDNNKRVKRSSFIDYNTFAEGSTSIGSVNPYLYGKDYAISSYLSNITNADPTSSKPTNNQIREFSTTNKDGMTYTYGLPVFARNEVNIAYNASAIDPYYSTNGATIYGDSEQSTAYSTDDGLTLTGNENETPETQIGQATAAPYATNYLLTAITTPDYQDRTNDGPTDDDFGGYTRFVYDKAYGYGETEAGWYNWRTPYNGFLYDKNSIHNPNDDMAGANWGEKEVYYLRYIETKTHVAVFDLSEREDGKGACVAAAADDECSGTQTLYKLDKVTLFAKKNTHDWSHSTKLNALLSNSITSIFSGQVLATLTAGNEKMFEPIKSVNFAYDNSLCTGLPNSTGSGGKLTLKKVWFEYKNIPTTTISPYEFAYNYPNNGAVFSSINPTYSFGNYGNTTGIEQNPTYTTTALDSWQNYRADGETRQTNMQPWVDQKPLTTFDPAAWQLKQITLPSGGQILVQYEQDDYSYVQDKWAHAMVSVSSLAEGNPNAEKTTITLNTGTDLDANNTAEDIKDMINKEYVSTGKRMYFKFLFQLFDGDNSDNPLMCNLNEYIDGYAKVQSVSANLSTLSIVFDGTGDELPMKKMCNYYLKAEANHKVSDTDCIEDELSLDEQDDPVAAVQDIANNLGDAQQVLNRKYKDVFVTQSYLRIPIRNKKGGGVRVKRLLSYNSGDTGPKSVFGNEYIYKTADCSTGVKKLISSGVATNEPSAAREENILVDFIPRLKQTWLNKTLSGADKELTEGPLGESLLPSPSVGYSQVIVKNIHSGSTNPGFSINEFNTAKDYPFQYDATKMDKSLTYIPIYGIAINIIKNIRSATQGFKFSINEMHGQAKSVTSYLGDYSIFSTDNDLLNALPCDKSASIPPIPPPTHPLTASTRTEYTYFEPGENLPTITKQSLIDPRDPTFFTSASWNGKLYQSAESMPLGQEIDVTMEGKTVKDNFHSYGVEVDFDAFLGSLIPIPFGCLAPEVTLNDAVLKTHATTKVIHYPAVIKKIESTANGLTSTTENKLFNRETGEPIVTITYPYHDKTNLASTPTIDESIVPFTDRGYVNYNFPASMQYANMSQKAKTARMKFTQGSISGTTLTITTPSITNYHHYFSKGDIIVLTNGSTNYSATVTTVNTTSVTIVKNKYILNLPSGTITNIEVIRSGNTNQLSAMAGSFTAYNIGTLAGDGTYTAPPAAVSSDWTLPASTYFNPTLPSPSPTPSYTPTNVVASSAVVYSDNSGGANNLATTSWNYNEPYEFYPPYAALNNPCSYTSDNIYEQNKRGKWRVHSTYAYEAKNASTLSLKNTYTNVNPTLPDYSTYNETYTNPYPISTNSTDKNYEAGCYTLDVFNWRNPGSTGLLQGSTGRWLRTNLITKYSPHGDPLEESNILGIKSCAKYGYNKTLPYLTAQNAEYNSVYFESFENAYNIGSTCNQVTPSSTNQVYVEDECFVKNEFPLGHSGYYGYMIGNKPNTTPYQSLAIDVASSNFSLDAAVAARPFSVKFWAKSSCSNNSTDEIASIICKLRVNLGQGDGKITYLATSGDWHLFERIITTSTTGLSAQIALQVSETCNVDCTQFTIDDVRIQPIDAQMNCYVYDTKTQQLLASFDDQHFGTYYQYNEKGQLVRKIIETERGKKTVQENQYNVPNKPKTP
ncbi:MAG: hypothetical protein IPN94_23355 [Sphingobacteriales bacterium]|nr:hypothetical protein [Sphingobacteriales bacterium]